MTTNNSSVLIKSQNWLPNWQEETQYSFLSDKENKRNYYLFAWQFLRRNKFYAQDFHFAKSLLLDLNKQYGNKKYEESINNPKTSLNFPEKPNNTELYNGCPIQWMLDKENRLKINKSLKKWGLESFFDPSIQNQECLSFKKMSC